MFWTEDAWQAATNPDQKVAGGIKIKKGKLRGVESCGMMCSIEELGSTKEMYPEAPENGIYIFAGGRAGRRKCGGGSGTTMMPSSNMR